LQKNHRKQFSQILSTRNASLMSNTTINAEGFEAFGMFSQLFTGGGIWTWIVWSILFPYSVRGFSPRFTHKAPSVIVGLLFLFISIPLNTIAGQLYPVSFTNDPASENFVGTLKTMGIGFILFHLILTLIRIKWTTAKYQAIVLCEIGKTLFAVWVIWGLVRMEESPAKSTANGFQIPVIVSLFMVSAVRLFYVVTCQFDSKKFNHVYFGTDSNCPMKKAMCMCWVPCDQPPADAAGITALEVPGK